jgi:ABC-2 type transport system permease protein
MRAMIVKEFRELRRDKRTLAMLIAMPLLLLVIFGYAANFEVKTVKAAVVGPQATQFAATLPSSFFNVTVIRPSDNQGDAVRMLQDRTVNVVIVTGHTPVLAEVDGSNLFASQSIVSVLNKSGGKVSTQILFNPELKTPG